MGVFRQENKAQGMSSDEPNHISHWEKSCEGLCRVSGGEE